MSKCYAVRPPPRRPADAFLLVCTNHRPPGNPLGPGCAGHGDALYAVLQQAVVRRGLSSRVWLARTSCLGLCPRVGAAVAISPGGALFTEATPADVPSLLEQVTLPQQP